MTYIPTTAQDNGPKHVFGEGRAPDPNPHPGSQLWAEQKVILADAERAALLALEQEYLAAKLDINEEFAAKFRALAVAAGLRPY